MQTEVIINSQSMGNPERHRNLEDLEQQYSARSGLPRDAGRVSLVVNKGPDGLRETPARALLEPVEDSEAQLAIMQTDIAEMIANGQPLSLFGDNLFLELDLSTANLPPGSRVRAGEAILEVTPLPHTGCRKFRARFGDNALRFISRPELRENNLRGIYMRVVQAGEVGPGDRVEVLRRATPPAAPTPA
jgi:MOSC domain-containing protein YiiM